MVHLERLKPARENAEVVRRIIPSVRRKGRTAAACRRLLSRIGVGVSIQCFPHGDARNIRIVSERGEKIGVKGNTITTYETGSRIPSDAVIHSICREFNISELWLRTGEGEPHIERDEDEEFLEVMEQIHMSDDDLIKRIIKAYWFMNDEEKAAIRKLIDGFTKK